MKASVATRSLVVVLTLAVVFGLGGDQVLAQVWPDAVVKQIDELKILARDRKDMTESMPGVTKITGDELKKWLDQAKPFVLLDNRIAPDYEREHIPSAIRLAPDDLQPNPKLADRWGKMAVIVNYCNGVKCWRSSGVIVLLQHLGFKNLHWYREGIPDWAKRGYPTVEGKEAGIWSR